MLDGVGWWKGLRKVMMSHHGGVAVGGWLGGGMELVVTGGGQGKDDEAVKLQVQVKAAWRHGQLGSFNWPNEAIVECVGGCCCWWCHHAVMW